MNYVDQLDDRLWVSKARYDALQIVLVLKVYKKTHGAYPKTLDELVPAQLDAIPIDPFSGNPVQYEIWGEGYRMYIDAPRNLNLDYRSRIPFILWQSPK